MDFHASIRTEEDARLYLRDVMRKMTYDDLIEVLALLPPSEEKHWLEGLIFEELGCLSDRGKFIV